MINRYFRKKNNVLLNDTNALPSFRNEQLKNGVTFQLLTHVTIETTKHTLMNTKINTKLF